MRGATPYALRGTTLAIPNGTLDNPAIRFGTERTGLFRAAAGMLALSVQKFQTVEITQDDLFVRSKTVTGVASPLAMARAVETTANNQEIALDVYDAFKPAIRLAAYRRAVNEYGWKLYGALPGGTAGAQLTTAPALTISPEGDLTVGRNLSVLGMTALGSGPMTVGGPLTANGSIQGPAAGLHLVPRVGIGTAAPGATLHVAGPAPMASVYLGPQAGAETASKALWLVNTAAGTLAPEHAAFGQGTPTQPFGLGSGYDASIYTGPSTGNGRLLLGSHGFTKLILDYKTNGVQFMHASVELGRLTNIGRLGLNTTGPTARLHVHGMADDWNEGIRVSQGANVSTYWMMSTGWARWATNLSDGVALYNDGGFGPNSHTNISLGRADRYWTNLYTVAATISGNATIGGTLAANTSALISHTAMPGPMTRMGSGGTSPTYEVFLGLAMSNNSWMFPPDATGTMLPGDGYLSTAGSGSDNNSRLIFGSGRSHPRMVISANGRVSIGANCFEGGGKLNVRQVANSGGTGLRIYDANTGNQYISLRTDDQIRHVFEVNTVPVMWLYGGGKVTIGSAPNELARLHLAQPSGNNSEGICWTTADVGGSDMRLYLTANGHGHWSVANNPGVWLMLNQPIFAPTGDANVDCGNAGYRWRHIYGANATIGALNVTTINGVPPGGGGPPATLQATSNLTVGPTLNTSYRLFVKQPGEGSGDGFTLEASGNTNRAHIWMNNTGDLYIGRTTSPSTALLWQTAGGPINIFRPSVDGTTYLGHQDHGRWAGIYLATDAAFKPSGGSWSSPSDRRTKVLSSIQDYTAGLREILTVRPRRYRTNGLGGTARMDPDATPLIGLVADEAEQATPELVGSIHMRLRPTDETLEDVKTLDITPLTYMLVNAIKELHARLEALEGKVA
jgi:hypothetical protein